MRCNTGVKRIDECNIVVKKEQVKCMKRKRLAAILLSVIMVVSCVPIFTFAEEGGADSDNYLPPEEELEIVTQSATGAEPSNELSGYCGYDGGTNVAWSFDPETGHLALTGTGAMLCCNDGEFWGQLDVVPWYNYRSQITSASIGEGITDVGWWALAHTNITEITLPSSVKVLGQGAFADCYNLRTVYLNDGLESIEGSVFRNDDLDALEIPGSVKAISATALQGASYGSISIRGDNPKLVIEDDIIYSSDMKHLYCAIPGKTGDCVIPDGVEFIEEYAFWGSDIEHVSLPDTLTTIKGRAFADCYYLKEAIIPDSVTMMDYGAFSSCSSITKVELGDGLTAIESDAFGNNSSLTEIKLGKNIKSIGYAAFGNDTSLTNIVIPDSVTTIDDHAFNSCTALEEVYFGSGLEKIGYAAFANCNSLRKADLPPGLKTIGEGAFYNTEVAEFNVPDSITSIGQDAFPDTAEVTLPEGMVKTPSGGYASISELAPVEINVKYGQTEARKGLGLVNTLRTGSDAWYWNSDDKTKTALNDLSKLQYDYELEKVAMQRAAEIGVSFSHDRPDGSSCFSALNGHGIYYNNGENIAIGCSSAEQAFELWAEKDQKYNGQGHRRNMLSSGFNVIGIGHAVVNGVHCWVQEFGDALDPNTTAVAANDTDTIVTIYVSKSVADISWASGKLSKRRIEKDEEIETPPVEIVFSTAETWGSDITGLVRPVIWSSSDTSVVSVESGKIKGMSNGTAVLSAEVLGKKAIANIGVGMEPPADPKPAVKPSDDPYEVWPDDDYYRENGSTGKKSDKAKSTVKEIKDLPVVKISKPKAAKKAVTVKWKKVSKKNRKKIQGVEIQYSLDGFKTIAGTKYGKKTKTSLKIKGLKSKKKYWVRIRAYKNASDGKHVSAWKTKTVKVK